MILTGSNIQEQVSLKEIIITPFQEDQINPNSYNFRLGDSLTVYENHILDPKINNPHKTFKIPKQGLTLYPNILYLGHTLEIIGSNKYVPIIRGRSSIGRIGIFINITADLIDIGAVGQWTLQLHVTQPVKIYPNMLIEQVTFWQVDGIIELYNGKYQGSRGPRTSEIFKDF